MLFCLMRIVLFLLAGQLTVTLLQVTFPASVCGMIYSFAWLRLTDRDLPTTEVSAACLVGQIGLLLLPGAAAIILFEDVVHGGWSVMLLAIVTSASLSILVATLAEHGCRRAAVAASQESAP